MYEKYDSYDRYDSLPYERPQGGSSMASWPDVLLLLVRQRWLVLGTCAVGAVLFFALGFIKAPSYTAAARIAIRENVAFTPVSDKAGTAIVSGSTEFRRIESAINTHVAILESSTMIRAALTALRAPEQEPERRQAGMARLASLVALDDTAAPDGGEGTSAGIDASALPPSIVPVDRTVAAGKPAVGDEPEEKNRRWAPFRLVNRAKSYPGRMYKKYHAVPDSTDLDSEVASVAARLSIGPIEKSNLIHIGFTDSDPQRAADVVNALIRAFLSPRPSIPENADAVRFFEEQGRLLGLKASAAKQQLRTFVETEAADLPFEQEADLRAAWLDLRTQRDRTEAELAEISARYDSLVDEVERFPSRFSLTGQIEQTDVVRGLKTRLADLQLERSAMLALYAPTSPVIGDLDRQIRHARGLVESERKRQKTALSESGPTMERLTLEMITARTNKLQLAGRLTAINADVEEYETRLNRLDELSSDHRRLQARAQAAEDAYITYLKKEEEARFSNALQAASIMNVEVVERAGVPVRPDPTGKSLVFVLGTILSLGVGLAMAVLRDRLDPSLKSASEVEGISGLPVASAMWLPDHSAGPRAIDWDRPRSDETWVGSS